MDFETLKNFGEYKKFRKMLQNAETEQTYTGGPIWFEVGYELFGTGLRCCQVPFRYCMVNDRPRYFDWLNGNRLVLCLQIKCNWMLVSFDIDILVSRYMRYNIEGNKLRRNWLYHTYLDYIVGKIKEIKPYFCKRRGWCESSGKPIESRLTEAIAEYTMIKAKKMIKQQKHGKSN